jgi:hypothetical protein
MFFNNFFKSKIDTNKTNETLESFKSKLKIPHSITKLNNETIEKIITKYLHTYYSLSFFKLTTYEESLKIKEVNYNAFEIGILLYFVKNNFKIHAKQIEKEMFPKYFYNLNNEKIEEKILAIAETYTIKNKELEELSENKLKQIVEWTPEEAALILKYIIK